MIDGLNHLIASVRVIDLDPHRLGASVRGHAQELPRRLPTSIDVGEPVVGEDDRLTVGRYRWSIRSVRSPSGACAPAMKRPGEHHAVRCVTVLRHNVERILFSTAKP